MKRWLFLSLVVAAGLGLGAAPAGDPEVPEKYMSVDEAKALLDMKKRVSFVDVRVAEQFAELHIRGAQNIPLRELPRRLGEVSRQEFLVLY
ncbi:MAG: rhodanese-like domain-containing protein [Candidatus Rokubacteria bacterium]|nr:rhodanese-like domain-containing protein [Candidatus Rokubacteria bacterium]